LLPAEGSELLVSHVGYIVLRGKKESSVTRRGKKGNILQLSPSAINSGGSNSRAAVKNKGLLIPKRKILEREEKKKLQN